MKKLIVLFAAFSVFTVSAQSNYLLKQPSVTTIPYKSTIDPMPNALAVKSFDGIKIGNNGEGFDLYKGGPDNMIVAKPDSSFYDDMPNGMNQSNYKALLLALSKKRLEQFDNLSFPEKDKTEKPFKLIKPEENKLLWNQQPHTIIPIDPFLPR